MQSVDDLRAEKISSALRQCQRQMVQMAEVHDARLRIQPMADVFEATFDVRINEPLVGRLACMIDQIDRNGWVELVVRLTNEKISSKRVLFT